MATPRVYIREVESTDNRTLTAPSRPQVRHEIIVTRTPTHEVVEEIRVIETERYRRHEHTRRDTGARRRALLARLTGLLTVIFGVALTLFCFRVLLRLIAANPLADFAALIDRVTQPLLVPFQNLTASIAIGGGVIELSTLIAMFVYTASVLLLIRLIDALFAPSETVVSRQHITTQPRQ